MAEHQKVQYHPVKSSNIASLGFDPERKQIHVAFHSGTEGHYDNCDSNLFHVWLAAPSKGRFHQKVVKTNPKYVWHRHDRKQTLK
jgi:KTSC domain